MNYWFLKQSELKNKFDVEYFPAYELVNDDLRDYRFYKPDLIHPNEVAEEYIFEKFGDKVDFVIDGGIGSMIPSTIVDCTTNEWEIIRQGQGEWAM